MSIEDLQSDLERNLTELDDKLFMSLDDVKAYFKTTIYPLLASVGSELEEIDNDVADMVQQSEDILQPETAGLFAMIIGNTIQLCGALQKRLKDNKNDAVWAQKIAQTMHICELGRNTLEQITVQPDAEEADPDADADDEPDVVERGLSSVPPASNENGAANVDA